jgi:hypothetical protein
MRAAEMTWLNAAGCESAEWWLKSDSIRHCLADRSSKCNSKTGTEFKLGVACLFCMMCTSLTYMTMRALLLVLCSIRLLGCRTGFYVQDCERTKGSRARFSSMYAVVQWCTRR